MCELHESDKETQKPVSQEMQIISKKHIGESYLDNILKEVKEGNVPATFVTFQIKKFEKLTTPLSMHLRVKCRFTPLQFKCLDKKP